MSVWVHQAEKDMAPRSARALGYVLDQMVLYFFHLSGSYLGGFLAVSMMSGREFSAQEVATAAEQGMLLGWVFWGASAWFLNYVVLQGMTGGSVGKMLCGTRVVNVDGSAIGFSKSAVRSALYYVSALPLYLGFLVIFMSRKSLCLHDRFCSTVVVSHRYSHRSISGGVDDGLPAPRPLHAPVDIGRKAA